MSARILVKGAGEMASAVAHRLFVCGFRVAMVDLPRPTAVRRAVSFCTAIPQGSAEVAGVWAVAYPAGDVGWLDRFAFAHIPVFADPDGRVLRQWRPDVAIDARIAKRNLDDRLDDAPFTIALGPGIEAGRDAHVVIETDRGHDLGRVITRGYAAENTGVPGVIGGLTWERVLRAPCAGVFYSKHEIGDVVAAGEFIGLVGEAPLHAGTAGVVRGLLPSRYLVRGGQKLGDVDPRGDVRFCHTLSDKARTISGSVLEVVVAEQRRAARPVPLALA